MKTANLAVFAEEVSSAVPKPGKLKRELIYFFKYYTISRVPPCERASPELSENVVVFARGSF